MIEQVDEDSFVVYPTMVKQIMKIPNAKLRLLAWDALGEYGVTNVMPQGLPWEIETIFIGFETAIQGAKKRRKTTSENGSMGGAPKGNQNARKKQPDADEEPKQPDEGENNQKQPNSTKNNLNVNVNVDDNVDDNTLSVDYSARAREDTEKSVINHFQSYFNLHKKDKFTPTAHEVVNVVVDAIVKIKESGALTFNKQSYFPAAFKIILNELAKNNCEKFGKVVWKVLDRSDINDRVPYILGTIINMGSKPSQEKPPPGN